MLITAEQLTLTCLFEDCGRTSVHHNLVNASSFHCPHCDRDNKLAADVAKLVDRVIADDVVVIQELTVDAFTL